jgi:hypothetical protein
MGPWVVELALRRTPDARCPCPLCCVLLNHPRRLQREEESRERAEKQLAGARDELQKFKNARDAVRPLRAAPRAA